MKKFKLLPLLILAIPFVAGCGGHTHKYELHEEVPSTCSSEGTEAYYTCSECSKLFNMDKKEISQPIAIEKDPNNHSGTKVLAVAPGYKATYSVGDTFDLDNTKFLFKCENCNGVEIAKELASTITVTYPTKDATCFTASDINPEGVDVGFSLTTGGKTFTASAKVTVGKKDNAIFGLEDLDVHCGFAITEFDEMLEDGTIYATSGEEVTLEYSEDGDTWMTREACGDDYVFNVKESETESTYYVKASSEGTDEYVDADDVVAEINVTHQPNEWNKDGDEFDYIGCLCKPDEVTKYFKQVTDGTVNKIVLSNETSTLSLTGTSYQKDPFTDDTIESIKLITDGGDIDLGTDLDIPSSKFDGHSDIFGPQTVVVTIDQKEILGEKTIPATTHEIILDVTVVTAQITNKTDWQNHLYIDKDFQVVSGYFEITQDITEALPSPAWRQGWEWDKTKFEGTIEGNNHSVVLGQGLYGLFPVMDHASISNLTFKNNWWRRTETQYYLLANKCLDSEFNNCTFEITGYRTDDVDTPYTPVNNYGYLFGNGGAQRDAFVDCYFDFTKPVNFDLPCLLSHSNNNTNTNTFEDCTLACKSFNEIYSTKDGSITKAEGLTIELNREETMDLMEVDASSTTPISITLDPKYEDYDITSSVFVHGTDSYSIDDITSFALPDAIKNDNTKHGENNSVVIKLESTTDKVTITVPVLVVTKNIANGTDFKALVVKEETQKDIYGYYKLTANLDLRNDYDPSLSTSTENYNIFKGIFDGNDKKITYASRGAGIFGELRNATIKNFTLEDAWAHCGFENMSGLLCADMIGATIENVSFVATNCRSTSREFTIPFEDYSQQHGWVSARICQNCIFNNCSFDATSDGRVLTLLGSHGSNIGNSFSECTFSCSKYYCLYQSNNTQYGGKVVTEQEGIAITGECVYEPPAQF